MYNYFNDVDTPHPQPSSTTDATAKHFSDGINAVTIGEKVSYLLKVDDIFSTLHGVIEIPRKCESNLRTCNIFYRLWYEVGVIRNVTKN